MIKRSLKAFVLGIFLGVAFGLLWPRVKEQLECWQMAPLSRPH